MLNTYRLSREHDILLCYTSNVSCILKTEKKRFFQKLVGIPNLLKMCRTPEVSTAITLMNRFVRAELQN